MQSNQQELIPNEIVLDQKLQVAEHALKRIAFSPFPDSRRIEKLSEIELRETIKQDVLIAETALRSIRNLGEKSP